MSTLPKSTRNYHIHRPDHDGHLNAGPQEGACPEEESNAEESNAEESGNFRANPARRESADSRGAPSAAAGVTPRHGWYLPVKRVFDCTLAIALLVVTAPLVLVGAVLVKLTSRGPALYRQVRVGRHGRHFTLLKLRTMIADAEAQTGPVWSGENDDRVTLVGDLLRRTHIDEFPQLWNVALGQMSLIGPRPERPEFVARLDWEIPFYRERLEVRPGITGLAQLRLPADLSIGCVRRKVVFDVYYVRHVNPALDAKLLVQTAWRFFKELCRFIRKCVVLPSHDEVERGFQQAVGITQDPPAGHATFSPISSIGQVAEVEFSEFRAEG
jgi:lipopolysaccharide/colanic/teichoic acid biosynthesis glycosyltransferase